MSTVISRAAPTPWVAVAPEAAIEGAREDALDATVAVRDGFDAAGMFWGKTVETGYAYGISFCGTICRSPKGVCIGMHR